MAIIDLKTDLTIGLVLACVHLILSGGFVMRIFGPGSIVGKIPLINMLVDPNHYLSISIVACALMVIIMGIAVYDEDKK
jgi:hypothetical protein